MTLPGQTITRSDGGLGLSGDAANVFLYVGPTSSGTLNTITRWSNSSKLRATLGVGVTVEAACWKLDNEGGSVDVLKTDASVAASNSAVTQTGTGPTVTIAGTATIPVTATVQVSLGGILGAGKFNYTLDGETWVENLTIPAGGTYLFPGTGITATFAAGTYVLATTYAFTTTPAQYNLTNLTTAWDVAMDSDTEWPVVTFCGYSASASAAATIAAGIVSLMTQMEATQRYPRAIISCGNDTEANVVTAFASLQSVYPMLEHGTIQYYVGTKIPGWSWPRMPYVVDKSRRCAAVAAATNPAWAGLKDDVCVTLIKSPSFDEYKAGETLHDVQINTMRTYRGKRGTYPTNSLLKSGPTSDYRYWQWGRVIDIASRVVARVQQDFINRSVRTVVTGTAEQIGCIDPRDAAILERDVNAALYTALIEPKTSEGIQGFVSALVYRVNLTNKILTTRQLQSSLRMSPLANIEQVDAELGFAQEIV
jgi:hypothetical protein